MDSTRLAEALVWRRKGEIMRTCVWIGIAAAAWVGAAAAQRDPLETQTGLEVGVQASHYKYEEPNFALLEGDRIGATGAYTYVGPDRWYSRFKGRYSYGRLDYSGSGTKSNVPDQLLELRAAAGRDYRRWGAVWSPYLGVGVRLLHNDLRGTSSIGKIGYRRQSRYFYFPLGVTVRVPMGGGWVFAPQLEYDAFANGNQRSYLSDTGLGLPDVDNNQARGHGNRGRLAFERGAWSIAAWFEYWNIRDSDIQPAGFGLGLLEPANNTREYGVEARYRF
jgi:Outer membrane protein beta-barrel domain